MEKTIEATLILAVAILILGFSVKEGSAAAGSIKKVGIFNPTDVGGSIYGYKGMMGTLNKVEGIAVEYTNNLSLDSLEKYDILIFPDCKDVGKQPVNWMDCLRTYVVDGGGSIVFYHDSVGFVRSPLSERILFPEVCAGKTSLISNSPEQVSMVVANEHFITRDYTRGYNTGKKLLLMYYDYVAFEVGPDGKILFTSSDGFPVIVCGEVGKGRVLFNGTAIYSLKGEVEEATGIDRDILIKTIAWFSEKEGVDKSAITKAKKVLSKQDAKEYKVPDTFIFPTPRRCEIDETNRIPLFRNNQPETLIIVGKAAPAKHLLAAKEIVKEVRRHTLFGIELSIKEDNQVTAEDLNKYNCIIIGTPEVNTLLREYVKENKYEFGKNDPGEQGYLIKCFKNKQHKYSILLAGSDDQGALYAAYSFIQLVKKEGGNIYAFGADVWDKPEFKYRMVAWGGSEPYREDIETCKKRIDQFAKMKINMSCYGASPHPELNEYAKERGVKLGSLCTYDDGLKEIISHKCMYERGEWGDADFSGFCPSDENLMKKRVEVVLNNIETYKPGLYWFHPMDLGYWHRLEKVWETRCDLCKNKFEDPAVAAAHMINTFYEAIKKVDKDIYLAFCLEPYQDNPSKKKDLYDYLVRLGKLLPDDVVLIIRENSREEVKAYREATGHPLMVYQWDGTTDGGTWATLFTASKQYKGLLDVYWYCAGYPPKDLILLGGAEYGWNPDQPVDSSYLLNNFAPRACKFEFGDAGGYMSEFFLLNIKADLMQNSWNENVLKRETEKTGEGLKLLEKASLCSKPLGEPTVSFCLNFYQQLYLTAKARLLLVGPKLDLERAEKFLDSGYTEDVVSMLKQVRDNLENIDQETIQKGNVGEILNQLKVDLKRLESVNK